MFESVASLKKISDRIAVMSQEECQYMDALLKQENNRNKSMGLHATLCQLNDCLDEIDSLYFSYKKRKVSLEKKRS